jgi:DNA gyrase subunit A
MTAKGYVKTVAGRVQDPGPRRPRRGGRQAARRGLRPHVIFTTAHAYLLFFSNRGKVYRLKAHEIPMKERTARGTPIVNLLPLSRGDQIQAIIDTRDYETSQLPVLRHPQRARSRRRRSTSTTRRCATGSSPSTCVTATSW